MIKIFWAECAIKVTKLDNITTHGYKQTIPYEIYYKIKHYSSKICMNLDKLEASKNTI